MGAGGGHGGTADSISQALESGSPPASPVDPAAVATQIDVRPSVWSKASIWRNLWPLGPLAAPARRARSRRCKVCRCAALAQASFCGYCGVTLEEEIEMFISGGTR